MTRAALLGSWRYARSSAAAWLSLMSGADDDTVIRAVARTLARPAGPVETAQELIESGEFEAAELLIADDQVAAELDGAQLSELEKRLERRRAEALAVQRSKLAELRERAKRLGRPFDAETVLNRSGRSRSEDERRLEQVERDIRSAETVRAQRLLEQLSALARGDTDAVSPDDLARWRESVEHAVRAGAIDLAEAALAAGPSTDVPVAFEVPPVPFWPHRREPLRQVAEWFFGEGLIPPGFERYVPPRSDADAWSFLAAVRGWADSKDGEPSLRGLAAVIGSDVLKIEASEGGTTAYFDDLSAPGLHALGRRRWPEGIPVWLPMDPATPDPALPPGSLLIRLTWDEARRHGQVLHLGVHDVLAVLHDLRRRDRLLALLGRQIPLGVAFDRCLADTSVRWARNDIPDLTSPSRGVVLLLGAPGMGKSTLLHEIARVRGGVVLRASSVEELPEAPVVLLDAAEELDERRLKALVREIQWARTTRQPAPVVLVAARPEAQARLVQAAPTLFDVFTLSPRSTAALREQAATMLGWIGIAANDPGSYDRMALLAGGNPTVLSLLCHALAAVLASSPENHRRFGPEQLEVAWNDVGFRDGVYGLLWDPLLAVQGTAEVLRTMVDFARTGSPLSFAELTWAINEVLGERSREWIDERVRLLVAYGLATWDNRGIQITVGGPDLMLADWLARHPPIP